jgi:hypothetical protein
MDVVGRLDHIILSIGVETVLGTKQCSEPIAEQAIQDVGSVVQVLVDRGAVAQIANPAFEMV